MIDLVFLGPPGAGKGTYARKLKEILGIPHISTGDIFREAVAAGTELGEKVKHILERGELVPDEIVNEVVRERLSEPDCEKGFILDGYPRTVAQAEALDEMLKDMGRDIMWAILFDVPEDVIVQRITNRRVCPKCGRIYNLITNPPKEDNLCDDCKVPLIQREDDKEEVVRRRYRVYMENTFPVVGYYEEKGKLQKIDGTAGLDTVIEEVLKLVNKD